MSHPTFRRLTWSVFLLSGLLLLGGLNGAFGQRSHVSEQVHFSAEVAGVEKPVAIPEDVLNILKADKTVNGALEDEKIPAENLPSSWFSASAVHLSSTNRIDFVVVGQPPISGGSGALFWVFRATDQGHEMVLEAALAHDLSVKNTKWKGYRNIELWNTTAVEYSKTLCRFNGKQYQAYRTKSGRLK